MRSIASAVAETPRDHWPLLNHARPAELATSAVSILAFLARVIIIIATLFLLAVVFTLDLILPFKING
jgi:hypothetical protein